MRKHCKVFLGSKSLGAASKKQHRKRTDTNDRLNTKVAAALTGMQSTLAAMGTNQASMAKLMTTTEKSSSNGWECLGDEVLGVNLGPATTDTGAGAHAGVCRTASPA